MRLSADREDPNFKMLLGRLYNARLSPKVLCETFALDSKTESRLERLVEEKMVRMDPGKKRLMDNLRVIVRNTFHQALAPFKEAYNNYRDDHDQFRQVTQSAGVIEIESDGILVHLMPRASFSPQLRRIISRVLEELNAKEPVLPDGSSRKLSFRLADRSELRLSMELRD